MTAEIKTTDKSAINPNTVKQIITNGDSWHKNQIPGIIIYSDIERTAVVLQPHWRIKDISSHGGITPYSGDQGEYNGVIRVDLLPGDSVTMTGYYYDREVLVRHIE